jgi:hypothetical protein
VIIGKQLFSGTAEAFLSWSVEASKKGRGLWPGIALLAQGAHEFQPR